MEYTRGTLSDPSSKRAEPELETDSIGEFAQRKLTAGVPLAKLIKRRLADAPEILMLSKSRSVGAERFRRLKTILVNEQEGSPQVVVITSAAPAEGKSLVAINLALAFAADKQGNVLLIDADLRRPTVEKWLDPPPKLGLSEVLQGETEIEHAILQLDNSPLKILPAGTSPRDPVELLSSDRAGQLMTVLRRQFQRIVIDTPPIVPFTDADAVGSLSDGALLVARADVTRKPMFLQALSAVTSTRILGTVLNDVTYNLADRDSYIDQQQSYYDYYRRGRGK